MESLYFHNQTEDSFEFDPSLTNQKTGQYNLISETKTHSDMELELRKQCENYLNKIKRQEQEIRSYRQHIENIEEDYQNLSNELISAEMANRQNEKKTISYQKTIASLKVELDSFYNTERTNEKETISQSSVSNISFSGESNIMVIILQRIHQLYHFLHFNYYY